MNQVTSGTIGATQKQTSFLHYIHSFRGVAIIFVVGGHILLEWPTHSVTENLVNSVFRNGTVLFVFIAGYLFQHLSQKYEVVDYWQKKVLNVILPYILISIPAILLRLFHEIPKEVILEQPDLPQWSVAKQIGYYYLTGAHLKPLWFVPMIILFYAVGPLLIRLDRNQWLYRVLPISIIISLVVDRQELSDIPRMFIHFFSVYTFGMFLSRYKNQINDFSSKWWLLLSIITIGLCISTSFDIAYYDKFMYVQKMFLCWFFIYWLNRLNIFVPKFFDTLADMSFGIFFLHYYFLLVFKNLAEYFIPVLTQGNLLTWLFHLTLILVSNCLFIAIVRRLFQGKSRYLIGC